MTSQAIDGQKAKGDEARRRREEEGRRVLRLTVFFIEFSALWELTTCIHL